MVVRLKQIANELMEDPHASVQSNNTMLNSFITNLSGGEKLNSACILVDILSI